MINVSGVDYVLNGRLVYRERFFVSKATNIHSGNNMEPENVELWLRLFSGFQLGDFYAKSP